MREERDALILRAKCSLNREGHTRTKERERGRESISNWILASTAQGHLKTDRQRYTDIETDNQERQADRQQTVAETDKDKEYPEYSFP